MTKRYLLIIVAALVLAVLPVARLHVFAASNSEVTALQQQINAKQEEMKKLQEQAAGYQKSLQQKQREKRTLANQLGILSDQISKTQINIETGQLNIEKVNLEINNLETEIDSKQDKLTSLRADLGSLLRYLVRERSRSPLQALFTTQNFSSFYSHLQNLQTLQNKLDNVIVEVDATRQALTDEKKQIENKRGELISATDDLRQQSLDLSDRQSLKKYVLDQTNSSEQQFSALLQQVKDQQEQANREVAALERTVRDRLKAEGVETNGPAPRLIWPIPKNKITTYFRDSEYPLRYLFEHNAIDVRAAQGTAVRAAASGYVAKVKTGNPKNYWYIALIHDGGLTTVYGHISSALVAQDTFVAQGQVIALTGGTPGAPGTGPYSTGPHLHFEVYENGVPVDPLRYLP